MRTGILTYHAASNFGANLQILSTVSFLKHNGHNPIVINWVPAEFEKWTNGRAPKNQIDTHKCFRENNLPMTDICRSDANVADIIQQNNIDNVFIGSDALWNYYPKSRRKTFTVHPLRWEIISPDHNYPNPFWGCFNSPYADIPRVAFSVSCQNTPYYLVKGKLKKQIGESLLSFKRITVRDRWTQELVEYFTEGQISPDITPDPVFAFSQNVDIIITREYLLNKYNLEDNYILFSFLHPKFDTQWAKEFEILCKHNGYQCVALPFPEKLVSFEFDVQIQLPLDPLEWYYLIKYSCGYIGERMHPIVVSLHNAVPFFSFDNYGVEPRSRWLKYIIKPTFDEIQKAIKSSKTYDIVAKAELSGNYYNYNSNKLLPSPATVFEKLMNFDSEKCKQFSAYMSDNYLKYMHHIFNNQ
ncbi:MAG: polysaccharide pyruvyl transferase family protein [Prevotellaceae bacterium]|jgi:hypothetical protein|nr:polysaccharide pyruvyl transferase family protein [Prevotellaceae bacterium]